MDVTVLYTEECGHCRHARETVAAALEGVPDVDLETIDVAEHPEAAEAYGLRSCPGVAVDGELAYLGVPSGEDLRERVRQAAHAAGTLERRPRHARRYENSTPVDDEAEA